MNTRTLCNSMLLGLAALAVLLFAPVGSAASTTDPVGDASNSDTDFNNLDASHTATQVQVVMSLETLLTSGFVEDAIEYQVTVNGQLFGICYSGAAPTVYDYANAAYITWATATYDFGAATITVDFTTANLDNPAIPADVFAESWIGVCSFGGQELDDRVPDAGTISTASGPSPPPPPPPPALYFHREVLPVGNVDLALGGAYMDSVAPTATEPAVFMDITGISMYNGLLTPATVRSIYDGNWLSTDPQTYSNDDLEVTWYATVAGQQGGAPGDWVVDLYSYDGTTYTLLSSQQVGMSAAVASGVAQETLTFPGITINNEQLLVFIQGYYPVNDLFPAIYYDSVDYPSRIECLTCGAPPPPPPPGGGSGLFVDAQGPYTWFIDDGETSIYGLVSDGVGPFKCKWSSPEPAIAFDDDMLVFDEDQCTATVEAGPLTPGFYVLQLDAEDSDTPTPSTGTDVAVLEVRYRTEEENATIAEQEAKEKDPPGPPSDPPAYPDTDQDGVEDRFDNCAGALSGGSDRDFDGRADACDPDVDGDGIPNGRDNCFGVVNGKRTAAGLQQFVDTFNHVQQDTDRNGVGDACEKDADGDGWSDALDNCPQHYNPFQADFDGDGRWIERNLGERQTPTVLSAGGNACDADVDGDGWQDQFGEPADLEPHACRLNPREWSDLDGDGICDNSDSDMDGDGWLNHIELDLDTDPMDRDSFPVTAPGEAPQSTTPAASVAALGTTGFILLVLIVGLLVAVAIVLTRRF